MPEIYVKDIDKEQLEIASTIFFFIMISLCFILIGVIVFVAARNLCISVMIYYGHV